MIKASEFSRIIKLGLMQSAVKLMDEAAMPRGPSVQGGKIAQYELCEARDKLKKAIISQEQITETLISEDDT